MAISFALPTFAQQTVDSKIEQQIRKRHKKSLERWHKEAARTKQRLKGANR